MYKLLVCFFLFSISIFLWSISISIKDDNNEFIELSHEIYRLDSANHVLTNKLIKQEEQYNHKIDSLSNVIKNIKYDVNKIRKYSTMIP